eukprot:CAMPEP_0202898964 /NCGR_PEP_ID=MMETSP1392-20130828/7342_1 /ASSEMBLY_ACC=CAM_ASM_000868 /TAXON_ID=225041 /ORGANISM="Chlamydomonas chlamydogama, Strain SAG 11-48b" /LENGTH=287 /DNA_ID=CAMNT_0049585039 /DNA_START=91 /DNA_END=954 /DNA_ORIENTATION=-
MDWSQLSGAAAKALFIDTNVPYSYMDFIPSAWVAVALLLVRLAAEAICIPLLRKILGSMKPGLDKKAFFVFDDTFIAFFSGLLEGFAVYVVLTSNEGCSAWNTTPCIVGYPNHQYSITQRLYCALMFHYYLYEMLGTAFGVGTVLKPDMVAHHVITMTLILAAYLTNLASFSIMWMALFDISNPILHIAKVFNNVNEVPLFQILAHAVFAVFALLFLVARVVATPFSVLYPAMVTSRGVLPTGMTIAFCILMVLVYALQIFWFYRILLILLGASEGGKSKGKGAKAE